MTGDELTLTAAEQAELDALTAQAADPAAWRRWERQAARDAASRALASGRDREREKWRRPQ
jgi:hypothetical protein